MEICPLPETDSRLEALDRAGMEDEIDGRTLRRVLYCRRLET